MSFLKTRLAVECRTWSHAVHASHYRIPDLYLNKVREDMVHLEDVFERGEKRTHKFGWGGTLEDGNKRMCMRGGIYNAISSPGVHDVLMG
jgi:hypothetical protein